MYPPLLLLPFIASCLAKISTADYYDIDEETCTPKQIETFGTFLDDTLELSRHCKDRIRGLQTFEFDTNRPLFDQAEESIDRSSDVMYPRGRNDINLVRNANSGFGVQRLYSTYIAELRRDGLQSWNPRFTNADDVARLERGWQTLEDLVRYLRFAPATTRKPYLGCDFNIFQEEERDGIVDYVRRREGKPDLWLSGEEGDPCSCGRRGFVRRGTPQKAMVLCERFFDDDYEHELPKGRQSIEEAKKMDRNLRKYRYQAGWLLHQLIHQSRIQDDRKSAALHIVLELGIDILILPRRM